MVPVTDEQAKAIQKLSEFGTTLVEGAGQLARFAGKVLGTIPEDIAGIIFGEPLRYVRAVIAAKLEKRVDELHHARHAAVQGVSPSLAIPLMRAACDEGRPELQDLWARLIAAAMDPMRSGRVRQSFIETLRRFDPLDARILEKLSGISGHSSPSVADFLASQLNTSPEEVMLSAMNLVDLKCLGWSPPQAITPPNFHISPYGRALIRACFD
jgi:hypothetical protein